MSDQSQAGSTGSNLALTLAFEGKMLMAALKQRGGRYKPQQAQLRPADMPAYGHTVQT
jgi:hypothetical protein